MKEGKTVWNKYWELYLKESFNVHLSKCTTSTTTYNLTYKRGLLVTNDWGIDKSDDGGMVIVVYSSGRQQQLQCILKVMQKLPAVLACIFF